MITLVLNENNQYKNDLIELFRSQGEKAGKEYKNTNIPTSPMEMYNALNEYILEGMPCDRVNQIIENNDDEIKEYKEMLI